MPAKIKQGRSKLVIRAQFDSSGRLQINGQVKRVKREPFPEQVEVLELLGETISTFLKDLMKVEVPKEAVSEIDINSSGLRDEPEQPPVS